MLHLVVGQAGSQDTFRLRLERSGHHFFDRSTGIHVLIDEVVPPVEQWSPVPRTLSVALTNACDLKCSFCYAPKHAAKLPFDYLCELLTHFDQEGGLEVVFGGGEPTLYPRFGQLLQWVNGSTKLAAGFTTHGHHLTPEWLATFGPFCSRIRVSIDALEPTYSQIRGRPLRSISALLTATDTARMGVNVVCMPGKIDQASDVVQFAKTHGIKEVLLIPLHEKGASHLSEQDCEQVEQLIEKWSPEVRFRVSGLFASTLTTPLLEDSDTGEFNYAHLSADRLLKPNSHQVGGIPVQQPSDFLSACRELNVER